MGSCSPVAHSFFIPTFESFVIDIHHCCWIRVASFLASLDTYKLCMCEATETIGYLESLAKQTIEDLDSLAQKTMEELEAEAVETIDELESRAAKTVEEEAKGK